jgi:hypothetical protein
LRSRLKQLYKNQPVGIEPYLDLANRLLELPDMEAANLLVDAVVNSKPAMDKLEDCAALKVLRSNLTPKNFERLEAFVERCWSSK